MARVRDVVAGTIRFTPAAALNDPFELRPIFDLLTTSTTLLDEIPRDGPALVRRALTRQLREMNPRDRAKLPPQEAIESVLFRSGFARDTLEHARAILRPFVVEMLKRVREQMTATLRANIGILSLTENPLDVAMWSHYADDHRGIVIGFDTSHQWFHRRRTATDEFFHLRRVEYVDLSAPGRTFLQVADENVLVTKGTAWASEREWRMLGPLAEARETRQPVGGLLHLFGLAHGAMSEIIFGIQAAQDAVREATDLVHRTPSLAHVRLRRAAVRGGTAALEILDISDGA